MANGAGFSNTPVNDALQRAQPGTTFEFASGDHGALYLSNVRGSEGSPITITASDSSNRPTFTDRSYTGRAGIEISGSSHVQVKNVAVRTSMWGIRIEGSSSVVLDSVNVSDIGQEGIRVTERSSWVTIKNSTISGTGRRSGNAPSGEPYSHFGEGIYLGTGKDSSDEVHNVRILNNDISGTKAEAIDVKQPVRDIEISGNTIHDIETATSGAVVVHIEDDYSASNPNIKITNNTISNVSTTSEFRDGVGIAVGSSAEIRGNTIRNTQHYGIRIEDHGSQGHNISVSITDNNFSNTGSASIWQLGNKANVHTSNNN